MRMWIAIPIAVAVSAALGYAACLVVGVDPHPREMLLAAAGCLIAGELSLIPVSRVSVPTQAAVAQMGLIGTIIHLFGSAAFGGALILLKPLRLDSSLLYWLLVFYWATLLVIAVGFVRAIKAAPVGTTSQPS